MDPVTQGLLGAAVTHAALAHRVPELLRPKLWWLGGLGGMAADLDIIFRWPGDPMVALTYHRHFTHSLSFVPIGGLLVALPFVWRAHKQGSTGEERKFIITATTLGFATHALLDAFTSYGTLLWWPFSDVRVAWNTISIIDPIYTLMLAVGVWLARRTLRARPARIALLASCLYMLVCAGQRGRARAAQALILAEQGFEPDERFVFPGLLSNTRWRSLSIAGDTLRADAIAVPWFGEVRYVAGSTRARFRPDAAPAEMFDGPGGERVRTAIATINWFGGERIYIEDQGPGWWRICDARYSKVPEGFESVFCWELEPGNTDAPVRQRRMKANDANASARSRMMPFGELDGSAPLPVPR